MRCPNCHNEVSESGSCPGCSQQTTRSRHEKEQEQEREARQQAMQGQKREREKKAKRANRGATGMASLLVVAIVLVAGVLGCYYIVYSHYDSKQVDAKAALALMEQFRHLASNQEGITVDQFIDKEFQRYKHNGTLLKYQGWKVNVIKGTETRFLIIFTFEDTQNVEHRAEWLADLKQKTFTPQTELASAAYKR